MKTWIKFVIFSALIALAYPFGGAVLRLGSKLICNSVWIEFVGNVIQPNNSGSVMVCQVDAAAFSAVAAAVSALATIMIAFLAAFPIWISISSARRERRFNSIDKINEWFDRRRGKFQRLLDEIDVRRIHMDVFNVEYKYKLNEFLSLLSTLNEVAFLVELGNANIKDIRNTSLGYWFTRVLDDFATQDALALLIVADRERGYDKDVYPYFTRIGPQISGSPKHKLVGQRSVERSKEPEFIAKVREKLIHDAEHFVDR